MLFAFNQPYRRLTIFPFFFYSPQRYSIPLKLVKGFAGEEISRVLILGNGDWIILPTPELLQTNPAISLLRMKRFGSDAPGFS